MGAAEVSERTRKRCLLVLVSVIQPAVGGFREIKGGWLVHEIKLRFLWSIAPPINPKIEKKTMFWSVS